MVTKVVRGEVLTFAAAPLDELGNVITPDAINLYVNYVHADGTTSTDLPIAMEVSTDGSTWSASFDTSSALPGAAFASLRATSPSGAIDYWFSIVANAANPPP
jgi:hypothetical protein